MRRWLTILLLVMLPLQFTWVAAAPYCQHEQTTAGVPHVGHHTHEHVDAGDAGRADKADKAETVDKSAKPAGKLADHPDCDYCHLSASSPILAALPALPAVREPLLAAAAEAPLHSRGPDHPERPNWRLAR